MSTHHHHFFTLQQLRATTQAGGVCGVIIKAYGDAFFVEIEMRSGHNAILVTARGKEPRRFKNPLRALGLLRDIGIVQGHFDLSQYTPEQQQTPQNSPTTYTRRLSRPATTLPTQRQQPLPLS